LCENVRERLNGSAHATSADGSLVMLFRVICLQRKVCNIWSALTGVEEFPSAPRDEAI
jgi:hypothetical protein